MIANARFCDFSQQECAPQSFSWIDLLAASTSCRAVRQRCKGNCKTLSVVDVLQKSMPYPKQPASKRLCNRLRLALFQDSLRLH